MLSPGSRMPRWVDEAVGEYSKRLPPELKLDIRDLPLGGRGRDSNPAKAMAEEARRIRDAMPARDRLVVLDVTGKSFSTEQLAERLADWLMSGDNYSIAIGGPDGLDPALVGAAELRWSLSPLTLPHPLVRVLLVEQLYRAWTINAGHPYHRS